MPKSRNHNTKVVLGTRLGYGNRPNKNSLLHARSAQLQKNSFLKFAFPSIWRMSSKYSTNQHTFAHLSCKQMCKI